MRKWHHIRRLCGVHMFPVDRAKDFFPGVRESLLRSIPTVHIDVPPNKDDSAYKRSEISRQLGMMPNVSMILGTIGTKHSSESHKLFWACRYVTLSLKEEYDGFYYTVSSPTKYTGTILCQQSFYGDPLDGLSFLFEGKTSAIDWEGSPSLRSSPDDLFNKGKLLPGDFVKVQELMQYGESAKEKDGCSLGLHKFWPCGQEGDRRLDQKKIAAISKRTDY